MDDLTANWQTVTMRIRLAATNGNLPDGKITFRPRAHRVVDADARTMIVGTVITARIFEGVGQVELPATDDPDISNIGWSYQVIEALDPGGTHTWELEVPISAYETGLDYALLVGLPDPSTGTLVQVGSTGSVASVNGDAGPDVVLTASDVGARPVGDVPSTEVTGLGTAATEDTGTTDGTVPLLSTGGRLPIARLALGTPDGTKFVADDGTLKAARPVGDVPQSDVIGLADALDAKVGSASVDEITTLTQAAYDATDPKLSTVLYVVTG